MVTNLKCSYCGNTFSGELRSIDKKDKNANEILQTSYGKSLIKKGLSTNESLNLIKQGEALYKTIYFK